MRGRLKALAARPWPPRVSQRYLLTTQRNAKRTNSRQASQRMSFTTSYHLPSCRHCPWELEVGHQYYARDLHSPVPVSPCLSSRRNGGLQSARPSVGLPLVGSPNSAVVGTVSGFVSSIALSATTLRCRWADRTLVRRILPAFALAVRDRHYSTL